MYFLATVNAANPKVPKESENLALHMLRGVLEFLDQRFRQG
jgi:hypothetical protein